MKRLYVGNLPYQTTEADLHDLFSEAGEVVSVIIVANRDTGRSRGFGFVEFATEAEAEAARQRFDGFEYEGRTLRVDDAHDRDNPRGGGRNTGRRNAY
ncbi:MAG: RNA-binding protein [Anaerolineae bacterium]|nr:RNA-binding protein [Anaerolineae bacterium]